MDVEHAAELLHCTLIRRPWYLALDISNHQTTPVLFLYVNSLRLALADFYSPHFLWHGFPVRITELELPLKRSCSPERNGELAMKARQAGINEPATYNRAG